MQGLREFNKMKRLRFEGIPEAEPWVKKMDEIYNLGYPLWGTEASTVNDSSTNSGGGSSAVVDPSTETVLRFSQIPSDKNPSTFTTTLGPLQRQIVGGGSNAYTRAICSFHKQPTAIPINLTASFMTPVFRMDVTASNLTTNSFGLVCFPAVSAQGGDGSSNAWQQGSHSFTGAFSVMGSVWTMPSENQRFALIIKVSGPSGVWKFEMHEFRTDFSLGLLQSRNLDISIKHNSWVGFARDNYNYWLYSFPPTEGTFAIANARWDRLCTVAEFDVSSAPIKHAWLMNMYNSPGATGTQTYTQQMATPLL